VERWSGELDVVFFHGRIELDRELLGRFPDDLLARAGTLGHEDLQVAPDLALASQSDPGSVQGFDVLHLIRRRHGRGDVGHARIDIVLLEISFFDANFALAADFFVSAERFDINAKGLGCLEDGLAVLDLAAPARGLKYDLVCLRHLIPP
jgi:hypothetical protein